MVKTVCDAGINWIQLRVKNLDENLWLELGEEVKKVTDSYKATLIINDNVNIAQEIDADGVHLGKTDTSPLEARKILGPNKIIGGTANESKDIYFLMESQVNYIGLGPYRFTTTKKELAPILKSEMISSLISIQSHIPIILIGGILPLDIQTIMQYGAYGVAVSSGINSVNDKERIIQLFQEQISKFIK